MRKINWFTRLFMSWDTLVDNVRQQMEQDINEKLLILEKEKNEKINSLEQEKIRLETEIKGFETNLVTKEDVITNLTKTKDEKELQINKLKEKIAEIESTEKNLRENISEEKRKSSVKENDISHLNKQIANFNKEMQKSQDQINELKENIGVIKSSENTFRNDAFSNKETISLKQNEINNLKGILQERKNEMDKYWANINKKLIPLEKIENTFFAQSGNKGKGELGEMQVKSILEKSGLSKELWAENLIVGKNQVEFAIKSGTNDKWIPVDSKVLDAEIEDNKIVIDSKYKSRVITQAKEVAKYLNKANTAPYGLLVLQNDQIYMQLYEMYPEFFRNMITDYKIYICSPSSFVQFSWSISHIINIYEKVHNDEKIYNQMMDALTTATKLSRALLKVHKNFNIAMEKHYPTLQKRQIKLQNKLDKDNKIKELPLINAL